MKIIFWPLRAQVCRLSGRRIDLEGANVSAYQPHGPSGLEGLANGLKPQSNGTFGRFSLRAPPAGSQYADVASVTLRFTFYDAGPEGRDAAHAQPVHSAHTTPAEALCGDPCPSPARPVG